jgi:hypothetical protein
MLTGLIQRINGVSEDRIEYEYEYRDAEYEYDPSHREATGSAALFQLSPRLEPGALPRQGLCGRFGPQGVAQCGDCAAGRREARPPPGGSGYKEGRVVSAHRA